MSIPRRLEITPAMSNNHDSVFRYGLTTTLIWIQDAPAHCTGSTVVPMTNFPNPDQLYYCIHTIKCPCYNKSIAWLL